jgi:hypothetical protein
LNQKTILNIIAITLKFSSEIKSLVVITKCLIISVQIKEEMQNTLSEIQEETLACLNEINLQSR